MMSSWEESWRGPRPELLAAYADGELEGPAFQRLKAQVEDWLASHPEVAAELAADRRLQDLLQAAAPAEPSEARWDAVRVQISSHLDRAGRPGSGGRWLAWAAAGLTTAAAIWLVVTLASRPGGPDLTVVKPRTGPVPKESAPGRPFPVATEEEVEILSVDGADTGTVAVGRLPLQGPVVLAEPGEVTLTSVKPAPPDNMVPDMQLEGKAAPMIWARLDGEREE